MATVLAPFTPQQVTALNAWQNRGDMHPFTCPNHSSESLVASPAGWRCAVKECEYKQNWAHDFMATSPRD